MRLTHLSLTNFRGFARLDIDVPGGPILLVGGNAQGKTSLVEAVYFLATFTSFQAAHERQLINFLSPREPITVARIVADYCHTENPSHQTEHSRGHHRLEVRLIQEEGEYNGSSRLRKEILLDGVKQKIGEAVGAFNAVLFLPQMLQIIEGAPEERRRYLNLAMGQVIPHYLVRVTEYSRVLTQRNALLKQLYERGGDAGQLTYWDKQLAELGAQIIHARIQAVKELERLAARFHRQLTRGQEILRLSYIPAYDPMPKPQKQYALPLDAPVDRSGLTVEKIQEGFMECLVKVRSEEIQRGNTAMGPHRDDLRFLSNRVDLGLYGSRGQARTAVLALKLAEVAWMNKITGQWPVLLLDEVLAELDPDRRQDLLAQLQEAEQALLTTTDLELFSEDFLGKTSIWHIEQGRVTRS